MDYQLTKNIRDDEGLRRSFMALAYKTFGISFEEWHDKGFWTDKYIPYAMIKDGRVVSNASVNMIDFKFYGQTKRWIQIGTVMTDEVFRGHGLVRRLLETIIGEWKEKCDCIYLSANGTVLDLYPKFGFERADEYEYYFRPGKVKNYVNFRRLCMDSPKDRTVFERCYEKANPFSALACVNNFGLLMFYALGPMKDNIYYSEEAEAVCIGAAKGDVWVCFDIFGGSDFPAERLLMPAEAAMSAKKVLFGFTPVQTDGLECLKIDVAVNDEYLFVLKDMENAFKEKKLMLPALSHA